MVWLQGSKVFNDTVMRQRLPQGAYESLKQTQRLGLSLEE